MRWIYFLILVAMFSCSGKWHAQQAKRHELLAEAKGVKVSRDTVYKTQYIRVLVPGDSAVEEFDSVFDLDGFENDIGRNDSLVTEINRLKNDSLGTALDKERTLALLVKANKDLTALRSRLVRGYSKDSTYVLAPDSLTTISIRIEYGVLKSVNYKRKEATVEVKQTIPIEIRKIMEWGYTFWQILAAGVSLLLVGIIVGYLIKRK